MPYLRSAVVAASLAFSAAPGLIAQAPPASATLHWQVPDVLPPGALLAVVSGNPAGPGESVIQLSMPDGYRLPPHFHPHNEHVEVREGTLLVGMGDHLDHTHTGTLVVGDSATAPAGMHHFSIAKGRTVLLVTFIGPYTITYVRAEDAPRTRAFPYSY